MSVIISSQNQRITLTLELTTQTQNHKPLVSGAALRVGMAGRIAVLALIMAGCDGFQIFSLAGVGRNRILHTSSLNKAHAWAKTASRSFPLSTTSRRAGDAKGGALQVRAAAWGGDLSDEAAKCALVVQNASELCLKLAEDLTTTKESLGKDMKKEDTQKGISVIKEGDSSPVTAADFAIQAFISAELKKAFPNDRFMG